jgi:hypothetical protein
MPCCGICCGLNGPKFWICFGNIYEFWDWKELVEGIDGGFTRCFAWLSELIDCAFWAFYDWLKYELYFIFKSYIWPGVNFFGCYFTIFYSFAMLIT